MAPGTNTDVGFECDEPSCLKLIRHADHPLFSVTVVGELLAGFACGSQEGCDREEPSRFVSSPRVGLGPTTLDFEQVDGVRPIRCWAEALP